MTTKTVDPIMLYAQLNPVPPERLEELAGGPVRAATFARISAGRDTRSGRPDRRPRRRLVAVGVVVAALAIPTLAVSGVLGSLFGFSNHGTPVSQDDLLNVTGFNLSGVASGSLVQLASRDGVGIYAAKTATGNLCYFTGPADQADLRTDGVGGGCMNAAASARFPSPAQPVVDISTFVARPPDAIAHASVMRLAGVAADGITSVEVLALTDCHVVAAAPVTDNVYVADNLPSVPAAVIVARDANSNAVWHESVTQGANASSCGLS